MKQLVSLLLMMASLSASADAFHVLVGYVCDQKADELRITYDGAYNEAGEAMMAGRTATQWNPWELTLAKDADHIGSLKTLQAKCRLSDGTYDIEIAPSPGNFSVQGRCGAWMTARAKVSKKKKVIYSINRFSNDCFDMDAPIVTRVFIGPKRTRPVEISVSYDEFLK